MGAARIAEFTMEEQDNCLEHLREVGSYDYVHNEQPRHFFDYEFNKPNCVVEDYTHEKFMRQLRQRKYKFTPPRPVAPKPMSRNEFLDSGGELPDDTDQLSLHEFLAIGGWLADTLLED